MKRRNAKKFCAATTSVKSGRNRVSGLQALHCPISKRRKHALTRRRRLGQRQNQPGDRHHPCGAKPGHKTRGCACCGQFGAGMRSWQGGISAFKREGDGATPLARMRLLYGYRRGDKKNLPSSRLRLRRVRPRRRLVRCARRPNYNRPVQLSHKASHEDMWRKDDLYDVCIVMDWNIAPRRRSLRQCDFLSPARPGYTPTEGCIALKRAGYGAPPAASDRSNRHSCPAMKTPVDRNEPRALRCHWHPVDWLTRT